MKYSICLLLLALTLFVTGCSKDSVVNPSNDTSNSGNMLLKFDNTNTPQNVVTITAALTRTGYTTISGTMNILTDSSAQISLQNLAAGTWHLKIEAKDNSGSIVYQGETDVTITAGIITQVSLTLQPTGSTVGSIYILVNWGVGLNTWIDFIGNPILTSTGATFDILGMTSSIVLIEGNTFKMWHTNSTSSWTGSVGYSTSSDGINWTRALSQPVLTKGSFGAWDGYSIGIGPVIKVDGVYRMYYSGLNSASGSYCIGLATSTDGINWTKRADPVLRGSYSWETNIGGGDIIKISNTYYLYYTGSDGTYYRTGLATSSDGIIWTKYSGNPILAPSKTWEGNGSSSPSVIEDNGKYLMVFQNAKSGLTGFGKATSVDGINWVKDDSNPFFTGQKTYNNWVSYVQYPCLRKYNNELRVYYSGYNSTTVQNSLGMVRCFR